MVGSGLNWHLKYALTLRHVYSKLWIGGGLYKHIGKQKAGLVAPLINPKMALLIRQYSKPSCRGQWQQRYPEPIS